MNANHVGNNAPAIFAPGAAGDSCEPVADRPAKERPECEVEAYSLS